MLSPTNQAVEFYAFFTAEKQGKAGLVVTVDVWRGTTQVVTDGAATAVGGGLYRYTLAGGSTAAAESYAAVFKTADATVDARHVPSLWAVGRGMAAGLSAAAGGQTGLARAGDVPAPQQVSIEGDGVEIE